MDCSLSNAACESASFAFEVVHSANAVVSDWRAASTAVLREISSGESGAAAAFLPASASSRCALQLRGKLSRLRFQRLHIRPAAGALRLIQLLAGRAHRHQLVHQAVQIFLLVFVERIVFQERRRPAA